MTQAQTALKTGNKNGHIVAINYVVKIEYTFADGSTLVVPMNGKPWTM